MSLSTDSGKQYHLCCTGDALDTANAHAVEADITLFGSCFCPFVQRVWVAFEYLGIPYRVHEVDPYKKPEELLEVSPKGLVPGLKLHTFAPPRGLNESTVILEYLEDLAGDTTGRTLLPPRTDPYARALVRWAGSGLWCDGGELNWTDVMVGPWLFRTSNVLRHYRAFDLPAGSKLRAWLDRLFAHPSVKATCSTEELYLDSYERYAFNRPNTSQVANAINAGRGLP
ncbi:glutathione S-transferase [Lactifluus subvellereus]|nr:glutathione S-transferase [Lactifluus subvellereus]